LQVLRTTDKLLLAAAACAAVVGVWMLRHYDPNVVGNFFPKCLFHEATGYWCIGCGLTRAMHALVHGDLARAFSMNPLAMIVLPLLPLMLLHDRGVRPRMLQPMMSVLMTPKLWMFLLPAYWIARNLPWWPFTLLAPG